MPRKTKYTRELVVEAGLAQLEEIGWEGFTPKRVAEWLGCSTMPIFHHFATMDEFRKAVLDSAWNLLIEYSSRNYTGDIWVDQSIGYVLFARDHGRLFSCMHYGSPEDLMERRYKFWLDLSKSQVKYQPFEDLSETQLQWVKHIRSLLSHGLAISVSTEIATAWDNDEVIKKVMALCSKILIDGFSMEEDSLKEISRLLPKETRKRIQGISVEKNPEVSG